MQFRQQCQQRALARCCQQCQRRMRDFASRASAILQIYKQKYILANFYSTSFTQPQSKCLLLLKFRNNKSDNILFKNIS
jgi:hypothetical protein